MLRIDQQAGIRRSLRRIRCALGLTQDDVAQLLNMTRISYHRIESGHQRISLGRLALICRGLGCSIGDLIQDDPIAVAAYTAAARSILGTGEPTRPI